MYIVHVVFVCLTHAFVHTHVVPLSRMLSHNNMYLFPQHILPPCPNLYTRYGSGLYLQAKVKLNPPPPPEPLPKPRRLSFRRQGSRQSNLQSPVETSFSPRTRSFFRQGSHPKSPVETTATAFFDGGDPQRYSVYMAIMLTCTCMPRQ